MRKDEVCPKCRSEDIGVWGFNREIVNYECNECRFKWIGSRKSLGEMMSSCHVTARYKECERKKFEASSLEEFCRKFEEINDRKVRVWPYLPRDAVQGESDFGLIVESEHVKYEAGLSRILFIGENCFLRRWARPPRQLIFDFGPIKRKIQMFENFARGLSHYLTEKGYPAIAKEIQHLDRNPERTVGDEDLKIVIHVLAEYC